MNVVLKSRLQSLFSDNRLRVGNRQKGSAELRLVDRQAKGFFNKACLNILRAEDVRQVGIRPSTEQDNKAGKGGDDKTGTRRDNEAGIGRDNEAGIGEQNNKEGKGRQDDNRVGDLG